MQNNCYDFEKELINILKNDELISTGESFLSEKDFQFNLARVLESKFSGSQVLLEYPVNDNMNNQGISYIDMYCKYKNINYYIELKYKTKKAEVRRFGKTFTLKQQAAYPNTRYYFYKDIKRLEKLIDKDKKDNQKSIGYAIFLTNDENYEQKPKRGSQKCPLWTAKTESKSIDCIEKSSRIRQFILKDNYIINWKNFKNKETNFKYLLIKID